MFVRGNVSVVKYHSNISYTVVSNFSTYWVKLSSVAIQVGGAGPAPTDAGVTTGPAVTGAGVTTGPAVTGAGVSNLTAACLRESYSIYLIKSHGLLISITITAVH